MQRRRSKTWLAAVVGAVMALTIALPGTALARAGSSGASMNASWEVPTTPMDNTIEKDGKIYKVLTTWAMAWSTSGPDFLGINNSSFYGNGQNGNANVTDSKTGASSTLLGVWASSANEQPNAFNWNSWYNLYAKEGGSTGNMDLPASDLACTSASWEGGEGVYGPFKYRPEIVWLCNNLSAAGALSNIKLINDGNYYASTDGITTNGTGVVKVDDTKAKAATGKEKENYAVEGDEAYDPYIIQPINSSPYTFVESAYELAYYADQVIASTSTNAGLAADEKATWKTMNKLPRSTRYTETPSECALNVEKIARGSVYYTLSEINSGHVARKKVAYVGTVPGTIDDTHVAVAVYDYTEDISGNITASAASAGLGGTASWSPLVVDQLGQDGSLDVYGGVDHAVLTAAGSTGEGYSNVERPTMTYSLYIADANDLASCDIIYATNTSYTVQQWKDFLATNTSTKSARANYDKVQIFANTPYVCNGSNFTMDKLVYGAYALDCMYPELFPNMMLSTYWYDKVYHIKSPADAAGDTSLQNAMTWAFSSATIPGNQKINVSSYNASTVDGYFAAGLKYYQEANGIDATMKRILANEDLAGNTSSKNNDYNYTCFAPSRTWLQSANYEVAQDNQIIVIDGDGSSDATITKELGAKSFDLGARLAKGDGKLSYESDKPAVASVDETGKVTLGDATGTAKITVSASETETFKAATKTVAVKLTGASMTLSLDSKLGITTESQGEGRNATTVNVLSKKFDDADFSLGARVVSKDKKQIEGATFSYASSNRNVASVDASGSVTLEGAGESTITVTAKAPKYENATYSLTVRVSALSQTISVSDVTKSLEDADALAPFSLKATVSAEAGGFAGALSYASDNPEVAAVDPATGDVTLGGKAGSAKITVSAAETYACEAASAEATIIVTAKKQTITATEPAAADKVYGASFKLAASSDAGSALAFKSLTPATATVDASTGAVKITGVGPVIIAIAADATDSYLPAASTITFTSTKAAQPMTLAKATKTVKFAKVKKAKRVIAGLTAQNAQGTVKYSISKFKGKAKKYISINKATGKITVKKGTPKKTYTVTVKASTTGNANYGPANKTAELTIVVKK